jgi:hypothetical protein
MTALLLLNLALAGGWPQQSALAEPGAVAFVQAADERNDEMPHGTVAFGGDFHLFEGITVFLVLEANKPDAKGDQPPTEVVAESSVSIGLSRGAKVAGWNEQGRRYFIVHAPISGLALTVRSMTTPRAVESWQALLRAIRKSQTVTS